MPATKKQSMISPLKDNVICDHIMRKRDGTRHFMFRQGYFYTHGKTSQAFSNSISKQLDAMGLEYTVVDHGNHWTPFNGGASIVRSSHFWVEVKIEEES